MKTSLAFDNQTLAPDTSGGKDAAVQVNQNGRVDATDIQYV